MSTEIKTVNKDLVLFDQAGEGVLLLKKALDEIEVKDKESRDDAFIVCKGSDKILKQISRIRIDAIQPLKDDKAKHKKEYEEKIAPIDADIQRIETYAKEGLSEELDQIVKSKKSEIMIWDEEEAKRQAEERRRLEEEERKQREAQEKKERAIREAEERKQAKIEEDKQKALQEAEKKKGIERAKAKRTAEEKASEAAEKATEAAAKKAQEVRIGGALKRTEFVNKKEDLDNSKTSGRAKKVLCFEIENIRNLPFDFLLNPKGDQKLILQWGKDIESKGQKPTLNGVRFYYQDALKYH